MSEVFGEMELYQSLGESAYEKISKDYSAGERLRGINETIVRLKDGEPRFNPTDIQFMYILAGMECAARSKSHYDEAYYIGNKLDEITP